MPPAHAENRERPESRDVAESLLYLSRADVEAIGLSYSELRDAVVQAFRRRAEGKVFIKPKLSLEIEPGHFFQALCAATEDSADRRHEVGRRRSRECRSRPAERSCPHHRQRLRHHPTPRRSRWE
jgi:hypothetical protein